MSHIASIDDRRNAAVNFLAQIFDGATEGHVVVSRKLSAESFDVHSFSVTDLPAAAGKLVELAAHGDTYVSRGLQEGRPAGRGRGSAKGVVFVGGVWADIDTREGPHSAAPKTLPADATEALALITEAGLPVPTLLIHTGGGCHAHWLYEAPAVLSTPEERAAENAFAKAFQEQLSRAFRARGYAAVDPTANIAWICKAPGTLNHKTAPVLKPVEAMKVEGGGQRYDRAELAALVTKAANRARTEPARRERAAKAAARTDGFKPDLIEPIVAGCAWMEHCRDDAATLSEPEWNAMLSITGRVEGGREISHELSKPYPRYDYEETETKIERAVDPKVTGPAKCQRIENELGFAGCARCLFRGKITSPINLAPLDEGVVKASRKTVYDLASDQYVVPETDQRFTRHGMAQLYGSLIPSGPVAALQRSSIFQKVSRTEYEVGDDSLLVHQGEEQAVAPLLNTWVRAGVLPAAGDASPILRHFDYLFPKDEERTHVLDYLAHLIQRPAVKIRHGLMIVGRQGTGKSTIGHIVAGLFGSRNTGSVNGSEMASQWTSRFVNRQVLVIEEAALGQRYEVYENFKKLFTDETFGAQDKNVKLFDGRTPRGIFMFSNHDAAITVVDDDRRLHVSETATTPASPAYFDTLYPAIESGPALPAFAAWLRDRDISGFSATAKPPETEAKERAKAASYTPVAAILHRMLEDEAHPFHRDVVTAFEVREALLRTDFFPASEKLPPRKVEAAMRDVGGRRLNEGQQVRIGDAKRVRLWALRNAATWLNASPEGVKAEYLRPVDAAPNVIPFRGSRTLDQFLADAEEYPQEEEGAAVAELA